MTVGRWEDTENILSPQQQLQSTPLLRFLKNKSQFLREQIQMINIRHFTAKALEIYSSRYGISRMTC